MASTARRRKGRPHAKPTQWAVAVAAGALAAVAAATAAFATQHAGSERGIVRDNGEVVEHRVTEEESRKQREYWTEERIRDAVRESKPMGPLPIERE